MDRSGPGYALRHALARTAIHEDLLPHERAGLHRAYAEAIERRASGQADEDLDTAPCSPTTGSRLMTCRVRWRPRSEREARPPPPRRRSTARRHFELALELWSQVPDAGGRAGIDHVELLERAGSAAHRAGDPNRALALLEQALTEAGEAAVPERRAQLLATRAEMLGDLGREEEGAAGFEEAVALLPLDPPTAISARVLSRQARALARSEAERARAVAERALVTAEAVGATADKLEAQEVLARTMLLSGQFEDAIALERRTAEEALARNVSWLGLRALVNLSDMYLTVGRYDDAVATCDGALPHAEQRGLGRTLGAFLRANRAEALARSGRLEQALEDPGPAWRRPGCLRRPCGCCAPSSTSSAAGWRRLNTSCVRPGSIFAPHPPPSSSTRSRGRGGAGGYGVTWRPHTGPRRRPGAPRPRREPRYRWVVLWTAARVEADRALAAHDEGHAVPDDAAPEQRRAIRGRSLEAHTSPIAATARSPWPNTPDCTRRESSRPGVRR